MRKKLSNRAINKLVDKARVDGKLPPEDLSHRKPVTGIDYDAPEKTVFGTGSQTRRTTNKRGK